LKNIAKPMISLRKTASRWGSRSAPIVTPEKDEKMEENQSLELGPRRGHCSAPFHTYYCTTEDKGLVLRRYATKACQSCVIKKACTTAKQRLISRWEHEHVLEAVQQRLDRNPDAMGVRRQTAEHPFGTIKCWMGATHFLMKKLPKVATEMALNVLAYNMKRVMMIVGVGGLLEAMRV
jgi:hypothetical protein